VRLGHEYVGTEHFLRALIREGDGDTTAVFRDLDIAPEKIRQKLEETLRPGPGHPTGPDLPYTSRAKKVLELSMEECARSHVVALDTAQLLVGLCAEEKGIAALVLAEAGLTTDVARDAVSPSPVRTWNRPLRSFTSPRSCPCRSRSDAPTGR